MSTVDVQKKRTYLRRFGCLAVFRPGMTSPMKEDERNKVLQPRAMRGINLGWSEQHSAWKIGLIKKDNPNKLTVYVAHHVVFLEEIMVRNLRLLSQGEESAAMDD